MWIKTGDDVFVYVSSRLVGPATVSQLIWGQLMSSDLLHHHIMSAGVRHKRIWSSGIDLCWDWQRSYKDLDILLKSQEKSSYRPGDPTDQSQCRTPACILTHRNVSMGFIYLIQWICLSSDRRPVALQPSHSLQLLLIKQQLVHLQAVLRCVLQVCQSLSDSVITILPLLPGLLQALVQPVEDVWAQPAADGPAGRHAPL